MDLKKSSYEVIIVGGGLAGLTAALELSQKGIEVLVIEKQRYPFHKVCGEYVSNEVVPYFQSLDADPFSLEPACINHLQVTSPDGTSLKYQLDLGGFGLSRYQLDAFLYEKVRQAGAKFKLGQPVRSFQFCDDHFEVEVKGGNSLTGRVLIGSFGKRSRLDHTLERSFFQRQSPYMGVKYHVRLSFPANLIALHNFKGGYCGISKVEEDRYCLCYLTHRKNLKRHKSIEQMEQQVLFQNPHLKEIFSQAEFMYNQPLVINEISFEKKESIWKHCLMVGDAAGMIAPLCGNGMAMAIHAGHLAAKSVADYYSHGDRTLMEQRYQKSWNRQFAQRLWIGRQLQFFFGKPRLTSVALNALRWMPAVARYLIRQSHGDPFGHELSAIHHE